jgi:hypothetical protein
MPRHAALLPALLCLLVAPASAATLNFSVTASEPVVVTGTPRIAIDVGGVMRYATYAAGSGTTALSFGYQVQPGDLDANGIALVSPLELNSGSIADAAGNPATALTFTLPDTSSINIQTYTASFTTSPITNANANAVEFAIAKAPTGASFTYTISTDGGAGSVTGSGTIGGTSHTVSGVDVSSLPFGTLTLSVTVTTPAGGTGAAKTASATPTFTGVLDGRVTPQIAVSLYRLSSTYSGPLIRVRRSSDNAEQNIGVGTLAGGLDTAALTAFCGSSSCYVSTWYDQSGNGRNATNATASWQPRIVNAGTIDLFNGLPAPYFKTSALVTTSLLPAASAVWSTHLANIVSSGQTGRGRYWGEDTNPSFATNSTGGDDYFGSSGTMVSNVSVNPRILSLAVTGTGSGSIWANGSLSGSSSSGLAFLGGQALVIGNLGALNRAFDGHIQTLILGTGSYPIADRQAIEEWLGTLSGIAVP